MTQSEAFALGLSRTMDTSVIRSKFLLSPTLTTTPAALIIVNPVNFGTRLNDIDGLYSNYRLKSMIVKWSVADSTGGTAALGFLDDASGAEGDSPSTITGVAELRCSSTTFFSDTVAQYFNYSPVQRNKWYYTFAGATGSDARLVNTAVLYGAATASIFCTIELDCVWIFKGALSTGS
jgi:hypothetical protein